MRQPSASFPTQPLEPEFPFGLAPGLERTPNRMALRRITCLGLPKAHSYGLSMSVLTFVATMRITA